MRIKSHAPLMYVGMTAAGAITLAFFYAFVSPFVLAGSLLAFSGGRFLLRLARLGSWQLDVPGSGGQLGARST